MATLKQRLEKASEINVWAREGFDYVQLLLHMWLLSSLILELARI